MLGRVNREARTMRATVTRGTVSGVCDQLAGKSEKSNKEK